MITSSSIVRLKKVLPLAVCCLLLTAFLFLQISCIFKESQTFDEPLFVEAGLRFLKEKDFSFEPFNPPFTRELTALPLLVNSGAFNDPYFFWPRIVVVLFSLGLAILVYLWSKTLFGQGPAVLSLLTLLLTPEILAYSHYANTDLISTFFAFLVLFLFHHFFLPQVGKFSRRKIIVFFFCFGLALAARTLNFFLVAIPLFLFWTFFLRERIKFNPKSLMFGFLLAFLVIWSTYFFTMEPVLGYRKDPNRQAIQFIKENPHFAFLLRTPIPLGSYLSTIKNNFLYNQTNKYPKYSAFWGKFRESGPGYLIWPIFLIKTPIPLCLFFFFFLVKKAKSKNEKFMRFVVLLVLGEAIFLGSNLRLRYFLLVYPLIAVISGKIFKDFLRAGNFWKKVVLGSLLLWLAVGTAGVYPHFLTYFNEFVGGRDNGYKYVVDSNLDWGQGLPTLKKYLDKSGVKEFQLAYFGSADPKMYGLNSYKRIKDFNALDKTPVSLLDINKPLVISASCWYFCGYYQEPILQKLKPKILDGQFLLFNFE